MSRYPTHIVKGRVSSLLFGSVHRLLRTEAQVNDEFKQSFVFICSDDMGEVQALQPPVGPVTLPRSSQGLVIVEYVQIKLAMRSRAESKL